MLCVLEHNVCSIKMPPKKIKHIDEVHQAACLAYFERVRFEAAASGGYPSGELLLQASTARAPSICSGHLLLYLFTTVSSKMSMGKFTTVSSKMFSLFEALFESYPIGNPY